jgi:hypothetical protein
MNCAAANTWLTVGKTLVRDDKKKHATHTTGQTTMNWRIRRSATTPKDAFCNTRAALNCAAQTTQQSREAQLHKAKAVSHGHPFGALTTWAKHQAASCRNLPSSVSMRRHTCAMFSSREKATALGSMVSNPAWNTLHASEEFGKLL